MLMGRKSQKENKSQTRCPRTLAPIKKNLTNALQFHYIERGFLRPHLTSNLANAVVWVKTALLISSSCNFSKSGQPSENFLRRAVPVYRSDDGSTIVLPHCKEMPKSKCFDS